MIDAIKVEDIPDDVIFKGIKHGLEWGEITEAIIVIAVMRIDSYYLNEKHTVIINNDLLYDHVKKLLKVYKLKKLVGEI